MKKYIAFGIAVILLVCTFLVPDIYGSTGIEAGKANGKSKGVGKYTEVADLFGVTGEMIRGECDDFDGVTLNIVYDSAEDYSYTATGITEVSKCTTKADSTVYITEYSQFIKTHIFNSTQAVSEDIRSAVSMELELETYIEEDLQVVRLTRFDMVGNGVSLLESETGLYLNKWFELDEITAELLAIPTLSLYAVLDPVYTIIDELAQLSLKHFTKDGSKYILTEKNFEKLSENHKPSLPFAEEIVVSGEVEVSTSNEKKPTIEAVFEHEMPKSFKEQSTEEETFINYKITSGINFEKFVVTFSNIDNTDIDYNLKKGDILDGDDFIELQKEYGVWKEPVLDDELEDEEYEEDEDYEEDEE